MPLVSVVHYNFNIHAQKKIAYTYNLLLLLTNNSFVFIIKYKTMGSFIFP